MILENRTDWNNATEAERIAVVEKLMQGRMKDRFEYLGMETFSCNGIQNRIAIFRHLPTEMIFHLLPGEPVYAAGVPKKLQVMVREKYSIDLPEFFDQTIEIKPFLISRYLITEGAWAKFDGGKLHWVFGPEHPIDAVNRQSVQVWAQKAGLQLPSEMEWEYACKGGSDTIFYWGNTPNLDYAWTKDNVDFSEDYRTYTAAEQKQGNAFGLLGMIGNLGEWVEDDFHDDFKASQEPYKNSQYANPDGILRGGWNNYGWNFNRSTSRIQSSTTYGDTGMSARVVFAL